jgi:hypothetical protein
MWGIYKKIIIAICERRISKQTLDLLNFGPFIVSVIMQHKIEEYGLGVHCLKCDGT